MKTTLDKIITYTLTPFSWIYWGITEIRNKLFECHLLKSVKFKVPVICVGNLSVGGTGKTPHVEYILSCLQSEYRIGVVSRGYKRDTKGFVMANSKSTPATIGDEPYQIYEKFGRRVRVAVCESRVKGIRNLLEIDPKINLIVLDDAFQHRYVKPGISVLLMDYNRPVYNDKMLPLGQLREDSSAMFRADMVVMTKCPPSLNGVESRLIYKKLDLEAHQKLYFSRIRYQGLRGVFPEDTLYDVQLDDLTEKDSVLLVVGVANPRPLIKYCGKFDFKLKILHFPDHHNFTTKDLKLIADRYNSMTGARKIILTTEKDAGRLLHNPYYPTKLKPFTFCVPIQVSDMQSWPDGEHSFDDHLRVAIEKINRKNDKNRN